MVCAVEDEDILRDGLHTFGVKKKGKQKRNKSAPLCAEGKKEEGASFFFPQQQLKLKQQPELTTQWEKSGISSMSSEKHGEQTPNYQPLTPPQSCRNKRKRRSFI